MPLKWRARCHTPQGGRGFFVAAVLFVAEEAGGLVTALGGAEAWDGGEAFGPFLSPCGAQGVAVEAVAFVVAVAFAVEVDTGYPVLARVAVVNDGIAEQLAGVVGMLAAAVFRRPASNALRVCSLVTPPMVVVEAGAVGVGVGVVAVEAAFVEQGNADIAALVGIADACRERVVRSL